MQVIKADNLTDEIKDICYNLVKDTVLNRYEFDKAIDGNEDNIYLLIDGHEIKGFALAFKRAINGETILIISSAGLEKGLKAKDYVFDLILKTGFSQYIFYPKHNRKGFRLGQIDYINNKINFLRTKEMKAICQK